MFDSGVLVAGQAPDVSGFINDSVGHASATWALPPPAAEPQKDAAAASGDDALLDAAVAQAKADIERDTANDRATFWKAVEDFCAGKGNVCGAGAVLFAGRPFIKEAPPEDKTAKPSAGYPGGGYYQRQFIMDEGTY